ncbi:MAG: transposase family protein [Candidatus Microthrix sp.]|nr:helix-turn-helix domain-containing protein [Candidatus Microthrix sp.]MBK7021713.1 transposase family protein [Candidatus Microthrix sp.]
MTSAPNRRRGVTSTSAAGWWSSSAHSAVSGALITGSALEDVPFARPGTRVTCDVENLVVWCAKTMDWTAASVLCRVSWRTVNRIIERVIPTTADLSRIEGLVRIGVDEISWNAATNI